MTEEALPVVFYDWSKGMDSQNDGILIYLNGEYTLIPNIKFYDTLHGIIQTDKAIYMPQELKR